MQTLMAGIRHFSRAGLWLGGALILLAAILIAIDVVLRAGFNTSIGGADELSGYALAIGTAWALGAALLDRAHIRIDSLYSLFPLRLRLVLDVFGIVLFTAFFGLVGWHGIGVFTQSWVAGSRSQSALETPLIIPQAAWLVGLAVFLVTALILLAHALALAARGDLVEMSRTISTRSAAEEIDDEVRALAEQRAGEARAQ
jgi:TRAP-type C4-dicarboxylate transport system permease small subunit